MAKMVLTAAYVGVNGTDYSGNVSKCEFTVEVDDQDTTTFGSLGWKESLGGLKEGKMNVTFKNDVTAGAVDSVMWGLLGTVVPFEVRLTNAAVGVSNPKYTGNLLVKEWKPISGEVGDVAESEVKWMVTGAVTRATS